MGDNKDEQSLWTRLKGWVRRVWCWFITVMVGIVVWASVIAVLLGGFYLLYLGWAAVFTVGLALGPGDVVAIILLAIGSVLWIIIAYYVLVEIWDWSLKWIAKRRLVCN